MIRKTSILLLTVSFIGQLHADFIETFDDNRNEWPWIETSEKRDSSIANGILRFENKEVEANRYQHTHITPNFDFDQDYQASVTLNPKIIPTDSGLSFVWNYYDRANYHELVIDHLGRLQAYTAKDGLKRRLSVSESLATLPFDTIHELGATRIGDFIYFHANGQLLARAAHLDIPGNRIALRTYTGAVGEFDTIALRALDETAKAETLSQFQELASATPHILHPLVEDFDNTQHPWSTIGEGELYFSEIANGSLYFENLDLTPNQERAANLSVPLDTSKDFNIDMAVKHVGGTATHLIGLEWDRGAKEARRQFGFSGNGSYKVSHFNGEKWVHITSWIRNTSLVKKGDYNTLSIRKIGDIAYYIVNDQPIAKETITRSFGHKYGLVIPSGATAEADFIHITYPEEQDRSQLAKHLDEQIHQHLIATGPNTDDFVEEFSDNSNNWNFLGEHDGYSIKIEDGHLVYTVANDSEKWAYRDLPINEQADFEASLRFTKASGPDNQRITFILGMKDGNNTHYFNLAHDGHYRIDNYVGGEDTLDIKWTRTDAINATGYNELTIKKVADHLFYYINGQLLRTLPFEGFAGNRFGVIAPKNSVIKYDKTTLTYQDRTYEESFAARDQLDAELRKAYESKVKGAYHAAAARARRAEEERQAYLASQLDSKDQRQLDKTRKQWVGKPGAVLVKKWGQPYSKKTASRIHNVYYKYAQKGDKTWYYWFTLQYTGSLVDVHGNVSEPDPRLFEISSVQFTDNPLN